MRAGHAGRNLNVIRRWAWKPGGEPIFSRGNSECTGPGMGPSLACSKNVKTCEVSGVVEMRAGKWVGTVSRRAGSSIPSAVGNHWMLFKRVWTFKLSWNFHSVHVGLVTEVFFQKTGSWSRWHPRSEIAFPCGVQPCDLQFLSSRGKKC